MSAERTPEQRREHERIVLEALGVVPPTPPKAKLHERAPSPDRSFLEKLAADTRAAEKEASAARVQTIEARTKLGKALDRISSQITEMKIESKKKGKKR